MKNDNLLLDGIVSDYFNSIEELFNYRLNNDWKINISITIWIISIIFLLLNLIPLLPIANDNYFRFVFNYINQLITLPFTEFNFWVKWVLGVIISGLCFGITYIPYKYWDIKDTKKALRPKYLIFCYTFSLRKELKSYLINDNESHLENCIEYLNKVVYSFTNFKLTKSEKNISISLNELNNELKKQYEWIDFTPESIKIINSISSIDNKIQRRLHQRYEIDKVLPLIDLLTLYEFTKIKPDHITSDSIPLKDKRIDYFRKFSDALNTLTEVENTFELDDRKRTKIISVFQMFIDLFSSSNIVVLFLSWFISLTIIFSILSLGIINFLNITVDSTILIGLLTAPFLGAITMVATIYSKNKNES